tara:strand:- start:43836 stop:44693 length:858 start_codon:yes stop_codon:yes gene_type:complete
LSRNKDRLGAKKPEPDSLPPQALQQGSNQGFSFVIPTEFVELPSGGKFYGEGHPLQGEGSIEIKQMTAKEEDMLTSRTLLKKGIAIDRVLESLIVDRRVNVDDLLVGDKNAIIISTRVSGYGSEYTTHVTCPGCGSNEEYTFDLNDADVYAGADAEAFDIVDNDDGTFTTTLPRADINVTFRLLTGRDEKYLLSQLENARKRKKPEQAITLQLHHMITSVGDDESPEAIKYLVTNMPSMDSRHLRLAYKLASPNIDLTQNFGCIECGHEQDMEVPLTADFFWPDR